MEKLAYYTDFEKRCTRRNITIKLIQLTANKTLKRHKQQKTAK